MTTAAERQMRADADRVAERCAYVLAWLDLQRLVRNAAEKRKETL